MKHINIKDELFSANKYTIGINSVVYNEHTKAMYIIAQVEMNKICAICVEPGHDFNRWMSPILVGDIRKLSPSEVDVMLGPRYRTRSERWSLIVGDDE